MTKSHPGHEVVVAESEAGERLDRLLAARLPGLSRARVQALMKTGRVTSAGGTVVDTGLRVKPGQAFAIDIPPPEPAAPAAEEMPLAIVYEDAHLIVIDKPAGLVVHPAAGHARGTLVNALIAHCGDSLSGIGGVKRPGIVHRLDKGTSGLLVVAKSDAAHRGLSEQFAAHGLDGRLSRAYLALVWGAPQHPAGTVDAALARSRVNRTKVAVGSHEGSRHAITHWRRLAVYQDAKRKPVASQMRLELETGRTHQIRVHMAHIGHPVLGDETYGAGFTASARRLSADAQSALKRLGRQALHATHLGFEHPITGRRLAFDSHPPEDFSNIVRCLEAQV